MDHRVLIVTLLVAAAAGAISSVKTAGTGADHSGISQFWTDDYKVFDQIYGRTSDKELFGTSLPQGYGTSDKELFGTSLPQGYGTDLTKLNHHSNHPVDKKERYLDNDPANSEFTDDQVDFLFGHKYQLTNNKQLSAKQPEKSFKFISTDFKPISQNTDPETYTYLKHLEQLQKEKQYPVLSGVDGFKPYLSYGTVGATNPEESDAYKSIQDILDAHEGNKGVNKNKNNKFNEEDVKYVSYENYKGRPAKNKKPKARPPVPKAAVRICPSGRCRKRATNTFRYRTVPYVRKIKKVVTY